MKLCVREFWFLHDIVEKCQHHVQTNLAPTVRGIRTGWAGPRAVCKQWWRKGRYLHLSRTEYRSYNFQVASLFANISTQRIFNIITFITPAFRKNIFEVWQEHSATITSLTSVPVALMYPVEQVSLWREAFHPVLSWRPCVIVWEIIHLLVLLTDLLRRCTVLEGHLPPNVQIWCDPYNLPTDSPSPGCKSTGAWS